MVPILGYDKAAEVAKKHMKLGLLFLRLQKKRG
ncbi:MAG: hypothetical protein DRG83_09495 [Deltaproteobacteria bacterium]|nr:MAG: hypothetical protein DRG83_09495 [Deltaproteobacteria bacterium]